MIKKRTIIISGPTASGKSGLALKLAEKKDITIINADSLQIYQGLPILSAQPTLDEQKQVKHYLYSIISPSQNSSVANWLELVKKSVEESFAKNKIPVIVGGTGMYISKLVDGISKIDEISPEVRNYSRNLFEEIGREEFIKEFQNLGENNPKILELDKQRLIRAFEVIKQTKKSIYEWQKSPNQKILPDVDFFHINLEPDREKLYQNCNFRFEQMLKNGALEEVKNLINQGVEEHHQISKTLGFLEIKDFLTNKISKEEMLNISAQKTRNYAKRQLTWFRNQLPNKKTFNNIDEATNFLNNEI